MKGERVAYPEKATLLGPVRVIPRELPGMTVSLCDLDLPSATRRTGADLSALGAQVLEELLQDPTAAIAALRGPRRFVQGLKSQALPEDAGFRLPHGAHVLITGGFGGIGLTVAEGLIRRFGVKVTLIARRALPQREGWPSYLASHDPADPISHRILALQRLEALGGQVLVATADVCNMDDMSAAVKAGEAQFGRVRPLDAKDPC